MISSGLTIGKYDTYKGSTLGLPQSLLRMNYTGKYDTYKGSTLYRNGYL